jgi:hypothetical protein
MSRQKPVLSREPGNRADTPTTAIGAKERRWPRAASTGSFTGLLVAGFGCDFKSVRLLEVDVLEGDVRRARHEPGLGETLG